MLWNAVSSVCLQAWSRHRQAQHIKGVNRKLKVMVMASMSAATPIARHSG